MRICHPFGNPNSYNAAISFLEVGRLKRFHTSLYAPFGLQKREHPELPRRYVTTHPPREIMRLCAASLPLGRWNGRRRRFVDWVVRGFDESTAKAVTRGDGAVYCYEDGAERIFERAMDLGVARIYELPIMHYGEITRIFEVERNKAPELAAYLHTFHESTEKRDRKDRELLAADVIVVPARLVEQSIQRHLKPGARFVVVPYGADVRAGVRKWSSADKSGPLQLFFAGILGPRKGLHVLFAALAGIPSSRIRLTLAGRWEPGFREWLLRRYPIEYTWLGQLPHSDVHQACREAHLFVFPSLAEGFGLVILEAMASGIPVIATDQTAGPDIIDHGIDGWIIPAGRVDALRATFEEILEQRNRLPEMGLAARRKAEAFSWTRYRQTLVKKLGEALQAPTDAGYSGNASD
jgi:alpha-maltose-1-phosphate synthase